VLSEINAVFCEPDDLSAWKFTIEALFANEEQRLALGKQAREDVQGYTWTARAQRILQDL
jgi:glycosyltransferase involved in cell wall biosynthesis